MQKLLGWALAAALLIGVGCSTDTSYNTEYTSVYPGITIFNSALVQNNVAMDGASVAIKLAMLLDEAAAQGSTIDQVTIISGEKSYLLKPLLFGNGSTIRQEEATGDYLITYDLTTPGSIDNYYRRGTYRVQTGGNSLTATGLQTPWSVTPEGEMRLATGVSSTSTNYLLYGGTTQIYRQSNGDWAIRLSEVAASFAEYSQFTSSWSGNFVLTCSTKEGDWSYTNHASDTFSLQGTASGLTFYAFDSLSGLEMRYVSSSSDPASWQPSKTSSYTVVVSGTEEASITSTNYSQTDYPSPTVTVVRVLEGSTIRTTVKYNGNVAQI